MKFKVGDIVYCKCHLPNPTYQVVKADERNQLYTLEWVSSGRKSCFTWNDNELLLYSSHEEPFTENDIEPQPELISW